MDRVLLLLLQHTTVLFHLDFLVHFLHYFVKLLTKCEELLSGHRASDVQATSGVACNDATAGVTAQPTSGHGRCVMAKGVCILPHYCYLPDYFLSDACC